VLRVDADVGENQVRFGIQEEGVGGARRPGYDVGIVGAGIIGLMISYQLASRGLKVVVLEKHREPGQGVTQGQAGVIHVIQQPFSSLKSRLARSGNKKYDGICKELGVNLIRLPTLLVLRGWLRLPLLLMAYFYLKWELRGEFEVELKGGSRIREMEPELSDSVSGGIVVRGYGVIDTEQLVGKLFQRLKLRGVDFRFNTEVIGGKVEKSLVLLQTTSGEFACRYIVNAAGLDSDEVAKRLGSDLGRHTPGLGAMAEYTDLPVRNIIAPLPVRQGGRTKGGAIIPTTHGTTIFGPTLRDIERREGWFVGEEDLKVLVRKFGPLLRREGKLVRLYAGVRPLSPTGDFVIDYSEEIRTLNLVGIESPGLTAAPAISDLVLEKLGYGALPTHEEEATHQ